MKDQKQLFPRFVPVGDAAVLIQLGDSIDISINDLVHALECTLSEKIIPGILEFTPAYTTLLIEYDPLICTYQEVVSWANNGYNEINIQTVFEPALIEIPVVYGGDCGPDLTFVAAFHNISQNDVIRIHTRNVYRIFMMGFTPGYAYLGGLDPQIATPRLQTPRTSVPAGSVGIAGNQAGIYPIESPGGWQIIGQTPLELFSPSSDSPFLLKPGDQLKFIPISSKEFQSIKGSHQGKL